MILTFLFSLVQYFFSGLQSLFSGVSTLPTVITGSITYILDSLNSLSFILPVSAILNAFTIVVGFEFVFWTFRGAVWIYRHIPFIGH